MATAPVKFCKQCGTTKPEGEFYAHPKTRLMHRCKACHKAAQQQLRDKRKRPRGAA